MATLIRTDRTIRSGIFPAETEKFKAEEIRSLLGGDFGVEEGRKETLVLVQQGEGLTINKKAMTCLNRDVTTGNVLVVSHDEYVPGEG